jgi:hypothetical protein
MARHKVKTNDIAKRVVEFAESLGFSADKTRSGHIKFTRENTPTVFFSGTPTDSRSYQNGLAKIRRVAGGAAQ